MRHPRPVPMLGLALLALGCEGRLIDRRLPTTPNSPPPSPPSLAMRMGDLGVDLIADMSVDPVGNIYLAGTFTGSADFDPGTGVTALTSLGLTDVFVAQYSATGGFIRVARIGGTSAERVTSLVRDAAGNLYLGGAFEGATDFDPGAGSQIQNSLGGEDGFVVKLSAAGDFIWGRRFGGLNADAVSGVAVDASGRVYATGTFSGSANTLPVDGPTLLSNGSALDGFLLGFDPSGAVGFGFRIGGPDTDLASAIVVTTGGSVVVGGGFRGEATFLAGGTTGQLTAQGGGDAFLASYTTAGVLQWARALSGLGDEEIREGGLAPDAEGGVAATGTFTGTTDFDPGVSVASRTSLGNTDWFAARYDASGVYRSAFSVGAVAADQAPRPAVDPDGTLLVTGSFSGAVDFDPGSGLSVLASLASAGATDVFVAKYTFVGSLVWVSRFGEGTSVSERQNRGIAVVSYPAGGVLVAGQFFGSPDFDPGTPVFRLTSLGAADGFAVLLTSAGALALTP